MVAVSMSRINARKRATILLVLRRRGIEPLARLDKHVVSRIAQIIKRWRMSGSKFNVSEDFLSLLTPCEHVHLGTLHDALRLSPALFRGVVRIGVNRKDAGWHPNEFYVRVTDDPFRVRRFRRQLLACVEFIQACRGPVLVYSETGTWRWTAAIGAAYLIFAHDRGIEYAECSLHYKFDDTFCRMLLEFKLDCFRKWIDEYKDCR